MALSKGLLDREYEKFVEREDGQTAVAVDYPSGIQIPYNDYGERTMPTETQVVWTFRNGGATGDIVATVTLNYTDSCLTYLENYLVTIP